MEESIKLKPCPFCGHSAQFRVTGNGYSNDIRLVNFVAECPECHISRGHGQNHIKFDSDLNVMYFRDERMKVASDWNERRFHDDEE